MSHPPSVEGQIVPGTDRKGHSVAIRVNLTPVQSRALQIILESRRFPYETVADIVRHGTALIIELLMTAHPDLDQQLLMSHFTQEELLREEEFYRRQVAVYTRLSEIAAEYIEAGDIDDARRIVSKVWSCVSAAPDRGYMKRFKQEFLGRFAWLF